MEHADMTEDSNAEHRLSCIVDSDMCRIDQCSCGTLHVRIRNMYFKLQPCEFAQLSAAIGIAGEAYRAASAAMNN